MPRDRRLSVGLGYRSRWGSDFEREPLHVYTEKERERAKELIQQAARQKYGTDMPPVPRVQRTAGVTDGGQAFEGRAMSAPSQKTAPKPKEDKKGGGGLWGKIKAFGEDVLDVVDAPAKYVGKPVFGVVSGLTEAERKPILDEQGRETGRYYRETASLLDAAKGIGKALTRDPRDTYREGKQAAEEYFADPNKNVVHRFAGDIATDPLNLVGIGLGRTAIARGAKMAASGGRGSKLAGSILQNVGRADEAVNTLQGKVAREVIGGVAGYTASALAGGDTEQNLRAAALGALGGNLTRGRGSLPMRSGEVLARVQGRPGRQPVFGFGTEEQLDRPMKRPDLIKLRHDEIVERPDLFQARDADPGKSYSEARVRELLEEWDPNKLSPGKVARDINTGQYVVIGGHHRLELMKRKAAAGEFPKKGTWEVFDADLTNPEHVAELQDIADWDNFLTASTTLAENVKIYRRARARGETDAEIARRMRSVDKQERRYLPYIADLPDDIIERWVVAGAPVATLGEIGKAARTYKWDEKTIRGLVMRYGPGGTQQSITPTELAAVLQQAGRAMADIPKGPEGGMFGDDVLNEILVRADEIASIQKELAEEQRTLTSAKNTLQRSASKLPEARGEIESIIPKLEARIASLKERRKNAINELQRRKREQFEGGLAAGATGTVAADTGQYAAGEWVEVAGRRGEIVAVADGQIRVRFENGTDEWVPTQTDMFGDTLTIKKVDRPATQAGLELEGGSRGQFVPSNQSDFLGDVPESPTGIPEAPQPGQRAMPHPEGERRRAIAAGREPTAGQLPRPEGEPKTFPVPGGNEKVVPQMRAEAPEGYKLGVPDQGDPEYRRTLTNADIETQKAKPTPTPLDAPPRFEGDEVQIVEDWATAVSEYHPDLGQPYDTQGVDYRRLKKAATNALRREYERQALGAVGADSLKELDEDLAQQIRRETRRHAERVVREVEDSVVREGHWEPVQRSSVGQGIPEGRPTGGVGGRVEEPTGLPELPGREPPPPGEPGLGNRQRAFGQDGPGEDLLLGREREALLAEKEAELSQSRNPLRRRKRAEIEIVRDELARTDHIINEMADQFVERLRARAEAVGLRVERQGEQSVLRGPNGETAMLSDVVEGATPEARAILESLTPEQREIFSAAQAMRDRVNATLEAHGVDVRKVETETGGFWSRRVKGREVEGRIIEKNRAGRSRRLGGDRIGSRTHESAMEGAEEGIIYDDPWEALRAEIRNKLTMAQAEYIAGLIQPLAQPNALAGFGYRPLAMNHPALDKVRFAGTTDSGGVMLGTERPVFPNEIADELDKLFDVRRERDTPSGGVIAAANAVLTPLRASADASFLLNQGMGELVITPQRAPKAIVEGVKVIHSASGNPHAYYSMLEDAASRGTALLREAGIEQDAVEWFTQRGAHYAGAGGPDDFQFPQKFEEALRRIPGVGKVPADVVRWSNETFARYLNLKRVNLNNDALERLVKQGLRGEELDKAMRAAIRANNRATGWTGTKSAGWQELALFAPRYFRSNIEQVVNAVTKGGMEGSIARRHLLGLLGYATVITYAINAARGYNTSVDPRDHNFLRIRNVGGHDISVLGPFASLIRAGAQAVGGRADMTDIEQRGRGLVWGRNAPKPEPFEAAKSFARAKASPVFSTAWSYITGATYDGKPIERDPTKPEFYTRTLAELGKESLPFSVQAALEEGPLAAATSAVGLQGSPMTPVERRNFARDEVARELFGVPYGELESAEQRAQVNMDERVARWQQESLERRMEGGGDDARRAESDIEFRAKMEANGRFLRQGEDDAGNLFSGNDYRKAYHDAVLFRRGQLSQLEGESGDPDIEGYFALYDQATMPNGQVDYDLLEQLQAEYLEENPGVQAKIDKFIGVYDDPVMQEFRRAQQQAREYYQIPAYRGMTIEDSRRATEVLNLVNAYVAAGEAANRRHAYQLVVARGLVTEQDVRLAIEAVKRGSNPERKKFRAEHAEFRKFYTDAAGIEGTGEFATAPQRVYGVAGRGRSSSLGRGRLGERRGLSSGLGRRR